MRGMRFIGSRCHVSYFYLNLPVLLRCHEDEDVKIEHKILNIEKPIDKLSLGESRIRFSNSL